MREIKFRGKVKQSWNYKQGEWVYGGISFHKDGFTYICPERFSDYNEEIEVIPESVGQFTGLYDKNGKEIYEGDVLEIIKFSLFEEDNPETQVGDVFWHNGAFHTREIYSSDGYDEINNVLQELCYSDGTYNSWAECKIIGNIHDNPELIKE